MTLRVPPALRMSLQHSECPLSTQIVPPALKVSPQHPGCPSSTQIVPPALGLSPLLVSRHLSEATLGPAAADKQCQMFPAAWHKTCPHPEISQFLLEPSSPGIHLYRGVNCFQANMIPPDVLAQNSKWNLAGVYLNYKEDLVPGYKIGSTVVKEESNKKKMQS